VDGAGNIYAAGSQNGTESFDYGNAVTAAATGGSSTTNAVLVKYNPSGAAQWAKTVTGGTNPSQFLSVAVDGTGNVYAAGYQTGTGSYDYGGGVTAQGYSGDTNVVLVKYDAATGAALWAKTTSGGANASQFSGVAADGAGNVYAAGYQTSTGSFDYGDGATAAATGGGTSNVVLVKYNSAGVTQWAKTATVGANISEFLSVTADGAGYVYAGGRQNGTGTYNYGGASVSGSATGNNAVLVKYDAATGAAQWAKTATGGANASRFSGVAADGAGNVYAGGFQYGTGSFDYGDGVTAAATGGSTVNNAALVKYNPSGTAQWAKTVTAGASSQFLSVAADGAGYVYAGGRQTGTESYDYGNGVTTATGGYMSDNAVLVKYDAAAGVTQWAQTATGGANASQFSGVAADGAGNAYAAGSQTGTGTYDYGNGVTAQATSGSSGLNVVLVKYPHD
jgi:outer membrane protein assembly factor BamB